MFSWAENELPAEYDAIWWLNMIQSPKTDHFLRSIGNFLLSQVHIIHLLFTTSDRWMASCGLTMFLGCGLPHAWYMWAPGGSRAVDTTLGEGPRVSEGREMEPAVQEVGPIPSYPSSPDSNTGWWFGTCFIFPYIGNDNPNWLIFFRGVQTTNQNMFFFLMLNSKFSCWSRQKSINLDSSRERLWIVEHDKIVCK